MKRVYHLAVSSLVWLKLSSKTVTHPAASAGFQVRTTEHRMNAPAANAEPAEAAARRRRRSAASISSPRNRIHSTGDRGPIDRRKPRYLGAYGLRPQVS